MQFLAGIVEGFYGRAWSWDERSSYIEFLLQQQLNSYLYCPKSDQYLRHNWRRHWPGEDAAALAGQATAYRKAGLNWGVGLSPCALYRDYGRQQKAQLRDKIARLDALGGNLLALLFDDMPGDSAELAQRQAEIAVDVQAWTAAEQLLLCPTYYSFDPVLERFFGARPGAYWEELGRALPPAVGIFWTGDEVCSPAVRRADIEAIRALLGRPPVLWDNYPVNDGARASKFLHLQPLPGREAGLGQALRGHFCNPMNQAQLSRYPLAGLGQLYGAPPLSLTACFGAALGGRLARDAEYFERLGLEGLAPAQRRELLAVYSALEHPAAAEVAAWLRGDYRFDPACLTDPGAAP